MDIHEYVYAAKDWLEDMEQSCMIYGKPLSADLLEKAKRAQVDYPEKIRVMPIDKIVLPPLLQSVAEARGTSFDSIYGITFRYAILVQSGLENDDSLIIHECVHVGQYERLGVFNFLCSYIAQCLAQGYGSAPLELEARKWTDEIYSLDGREKSDNMEA